VKSGIKTMRDLEMLYILKSFALFAALCSAPILAIASPVTYGVVGSFSGGKLGHVAFDFVVTADFSANIFDSTDALTINSATSSVVAGDPFTVFGGYGYTYFFDLGDDQFIFGGLVNGVDTVASSTTDFYFAIKDFTKQSPFVILLADAYNFEDSVGFPTTSFVSVTLPAIPLPAALPLVLTGLAVFAGLRMRQQRMAQV
jgi:hypothetical protein